MFSSGTSPIVEAQIHYRQQQIRQDFAIAHGWELATRDLLGRLRRPGRKSNGSGTGVAPAHLLTWR